MTGWERNALIKQAYLKLNPNVDKDTVRVEVSSIGKRKQIRTINRWDSSLKQRVTKSINSLITEFAVFIHVGEDLVFKRNVEHANSLGMHSTEETIDVIIELTQSLNK